MNGKKRKSPPVSGDIRKFFTPQKRPRYVADSSQIQTPPSTSGSAHADTSQIVTPPHQETQVEAFPVENNGQLDDFEQQEQSPHILDSVWEDLELGRLCLFVIDHEGVVSHYIGKGYQLWSPTENCKIAEDSTEPHSHKDCNNQITILYKLKSEKAKFGAWACGFPPEASQPRDSISQIVCILRDDEFLYGAIRGQVGDMKALTDPLFTQDVQRMLKDQNMELVTRKLFYPDSSELRSVEEKYHKAIPMSDWDDNMPEEETTVGNLTGEVNRDPKDKRGRSKSRVKVNHKSRQYTPANSHRVSNWIPKISKWLREKSYTGPGMDFSVNNFINQIGKAIAKGNYVFTSEVKSVFAKKDDIYEEITLDTLRTYCQEKMANYYELHNIYIRKYSDKEEEDLPFLSNISIARLSDAGTDFALKLFDGHISRRDDENKVKRKYPDILRQLQNHNNDTNLTLPEWNKSGAKLSKEIIYNIQFFFAFKSKATGLCILGDTLPHCKSEFCDLLMETDITTYLFQVKRKICPTTIAHAFSQIRAAIRTLKAARNNKKEMTELFKGLRPERGDSTKPAEEMRACIEYYQKFTEDELRLALEKQIIYVFAYCDPSSSFETSGSSYFPNLCYDLYKDSKRWGNDIKLMFVKIEPGGTYNEANLKQAVDDFVKSNSTSLLSVRKR